MGACAGLQGVEERGADSGGEGFQGGGDEGGDYIIKLPLPCGAVPAGDQHPQKLPRQEHRAVHRSMPHGESPQACCYLPGLLFPPRPSSLLAIWVQNVFEDGEGCLRVVK